MISVVMLVHNAHKYTKSSIKSLQKTTKRADFELVVLDNNSEPQTQNLLIRYYKRGYIDKLCLLDDNTLFARGNNIAVNMCSPKSDKVLLINSDVDIIDPSWLDVMLNYYPYDSSGIVSIGVVNGNPYTRVDGYCFMIGKDLYKKYQLDEQFEWWWSITKLQAQVLRDGHSVIGLIDHSDLIHHYGGASGNDFKDAKGMSVDVSEIIRWFDKRQVQVVDKP